MCFYALIGHLLVKGVLICKDSIFHLGLLSKVLMCVCVSAPVSATSHGNSKRISRRNLFKDLSSVCWLCKENKRETQWSFKGKWDIRYLYSLYILYCIGNIVCCWLTLHLSYWLVYFLPQLTVLWEMNVCAHTHAHTHTHIHSLICLFPQQFATSLLLANKFDEFTVAISYYCLTNFDLLISVSYLYLKTPCIWKSRMCPLYTCNWSFIEWVKIIFWGL